MVPTLLFSRPLKTPSTRDERGFTLWRRCEVLEEIDKAAGIEAKKTLGPSEQETEIVGGGGEARIEPVALRTLQIIAPEMQFKKASLFNFLRKDRLRIGY